MLRTTPAAIALAAALSLAGLPAPADEPHPVVAYSQPGRFAAVRDDLRLAIEGRGLVIDHHSHIHAMLERTGRDVGSGRRIYGDAQAFVFCSAVLSRRMMEADPANAAMCPYSITVYTTAEEPDKVHVAYRRPWRPDGRAASKAALHEVDKLLDGIAREALGMR